MFKIRKKAALGVAFFGHTLDLKQKDQAIKNALVCVSANIY